MENTATSVTPSSVGIRYGVLTGLVSIIYSFILLATQQEGNTTLSLLAFLIWIGGIWMAHKYFKAHNEGFMSYGQGITIGVLLSLVSGILGATFRYIYMEFIDPAAMQRGMEMARTKLEEKGNLSDEQIDQAVAMSQKFSAGPVGLVIAIVSAVVIGLILSLIISAITKNTRPEFE
ncbi:DUF4199 domain-containing protein [Hymenobacter sp. BT730]|uniref:DUF4199 domain-containing protein n=1 Tax=Hymenobacter sp. BT730 TaxID=3063332 RepID=UPI0026E0F8C5|nr:DUF4199 domain-containing protein [Hymenobacter sp. BT730]